MIVIMLLLNVLQFTRIHAFSFTYSNAVVLREKNARRLSTSLKVATATYEKRSTMETIGAASVASAAAVAAAAVINTT